MTTSISMVLLALALMASAIACTGNLLSWRGARAASKDAARQIAEAQEMIERAKARAADKADEHLVHSLTGLEVQAGDTLVITPGAWMSMEQTKHLQHVMRRCLPEGVHVLIVDPGTTVSVLKKQECAAS